MRFSHSRLRTRTVIMVICCIIFICAMSSFNGKASGRMSALVRHALGLDFLPMIIVRKFAHILEFFFVGLFTYDETNSKASFLFCISCALLDEFHQAFTADRAAMFIDVLIDTFGATLGMIVGSFFTGKAKEMNYRMLSFEKRNLEL